MASKKLAAKIEAVAKPAKRRKSIKSAVKEQVTDKIARLLTVASGVGRAIEHAAGAVGLRARAAGQNLFSLLVLAFLFSSLLIVLWISLLTILYVYLIMTAWTMIGAISMITLLNVILLSFVLYLITVHKRHLSSSLGLRR